MLIEKLTPKLRIAKGQKRSDTFAAEWGTFITYMNKDSTTHLVPKPSGISGHLKI